MPKQSQTKGQIDLAHGPSDLRGIEPHDDDGVGTHQRRVLNQAIDRVAARFLEYLGVFGNFAADDAPQAGLMDISPAYAQTERPSWPDIRR